MIHFIESTSRIGLVFNLAGSICLAVSALSMTKEKAIEVVSMRWGPTDENFPAVKDRMAQRCWAIIGSVLLVIGFTLQMI